MASLICRTERSKKNNEEKKTSRSEEIGPWSQSCGRKEIYGGKDW